MLGWVVAGLVCSCVAASAQDGGNVLVAVEATSQMSERIAARYVRARSIPAENVVHLRTGATDEVTRAEYEEQIEAPIAAWIRRHAMHDRIFYIVLTKGIPLRISGSGGRGGAAASVDSELTLLYRKLVGTRVPTAGPLPNPYFGTVAPAAHRGPFSHVDQDVYLVSRLDGFTEADVIGLVDRGSAAISNGDFVLDSKGKNSAETPEIWLKATADALLGCRTRAAGAPRGDVYRHARTGKCPRLRVLGLERSVDQDATARTRIRARRAGDDVRQCRSAHV